MNLASANPELDPVRSLPVRRLLGTVLGVSIATGATWTLIAWLLQTTQPLAGLAAAAVVGGCTTAGLLAIMPWKERPTSIWISLWMGQTVVRLMLTPALAYLLYSATSFKQFPLFLAVGLSYLTAIVSEAMVLSAFLRRSGPVQRTEIRE